LRYLVLILVWLQADDGINRIASINKHKKAAVEAYNKQDFEQSIKHYAYLVDSLDVREDEVILNFGHALFMNADTARAEEMYSVLVQSDDRSIRTSAYQQLGKIKFDQKSYEQSLNFYKNALRSDPANENARYNYELLKKYLAQQKQQQQQNQQNQDIEPSEFAKMIKKQADQLVKNNKFIEAYYTMERGLEQDSTVSAYSQYIQRLTDVSEVEFKNRKEQ